MWGVSAFLSKEEKKVRELKAAQPLDLGWSGELAVGSGRSHLILSAVQVNKTMTL